MHVNVAPSGLIAPARREVEASDHLLHRHRAVEATALLLGGRHHRGQALVAALLNDAQIAQHPPLRLVRAAHVLARVAAPPSLRFGAVAAAAVVRLGAFLQSLRRRFTRGLKRDLIISHSLYK